MHEHCGKMRGVQTVKSATGVNPLYENTTHESMIDDGTTLTNFHIDLGRASAYDICIE